MNVERRAENGGFEVQTYFVRARNALVARAEFSELYVDYALHQAQHGYQREPEHDTLLKETLAALTLHCASRPWNETWAWTLHLRDPMLNLFVTGDNLRLGAATNAVRIASRWFPSADKALQAP